MIASASSIYGRHHQAGASCDKLKGWGVGFRMERHMYAYVRVMLMYGKTITLL